MQPLIIIPKRSTHFLSLLIMQFFGAMSCLWVIDISLWVKLAGIGIIICHFIMVFKRYFFLRCQHRIVKLVYYQNKWILYFHNKQHETVMLLEEKIMTTFFILLNFQSNVSKHRYTLLLFRDSECLEKLRQLRYVLISQKLAIEE